jgi:prepilin-type N-terminal cleavage/methylation domain-containing protein
MKAGQSGFTLIEIMLSILLIGVVLTATSEFQAKGMDIARETIELTRAALFAKEKMVEWERGLIPEEGGDGDFGEDFPDYRWDMKTESTEIEGLKKVTLIITWLSGTRSRQFEIERLHFMGFQL